MRSKSIREIWLYLPIIIGVPWVSKWRANSRHFSGSSDPDLKFMILQLTCIEKKDKRVYVESLPLESCLNIASDVGIY